MSASDPVLRRVAVHADRAVIDLTLPATVPVAELIPAIVDIVGGAAPATRYRLARLGASPLPNSTTLRQNGIGDGAVLVLSRETPAPPAVRYDDEADAVAATLAESARGGRLTAMTAALAAGCFTAVGALALIRSAYNASEYADNLAAGAAVAATLTLLVAVLVLRLRHDRIAGLTLSVIATMIAAVAGLLAVPAAPGAHHVLLAAMAAATTATVATRVNRSAATALAAIAYCALIIAAAALAGAVTGAPAHVVGSLTALAGLGLIEAAPRLSIRVAGLMPGLDPDDGRTADALKARAGRARSLLSSLRAGFASAAAAGAVAAALATPRAIALATLTGVLLMWHPRADRARGPVFATAGISTITIAFGAGALAAPKHAPWIAVLAATAAAVAIYAGFVAPVVTLSPMADRSLHALGCIALAAVVPLACWTCGAFGAVRGLNILRA